MKKNVTLRQLLDPGKQTQPYTLPSWRAVFFDLLSNPDGPNLTLDYAKLRDILKARRAIDHACKLLGYRPFLEKVGHTLRPKSGPPINLVIDMAFAPRPILVLPVDNFSPYNLAHAAPPALIAAALDIADQVYTLDIIFSSEHSAWQTDAKKGGHLHTEGQGAILMAAETYHEMAALSVIIKGVVNEK